jgi:hypothetical protein
MSARTLIRNIGSISFHHNGETGAGYHVVDFTTRGDHLLAIVFEAPGHVAVIQPEVIEGQLRPGEPRFKPGTLFRGDHFEPELRRAIKTWKESHTDRK